MSSTVASSDQNILILIRLQNIQRLEGLCLLNSWTYDKIDSQGQDMVDKICKSTFGVTEVEVSFPEVENSETNTWPPNKVAAYNAAMKHHYDQFKTFEMDDLQLVEHFLKLGVDLRGENGQPLRCSVLISMVVEAVLLGVGGSLPDMSKVNLELLESNLAAEAKAFKSHQK